MSMIVNVDSDSGEIDVNHKLPDRSHFREAYEALEHNEDSVGFLQDDPMAWYSLLSAVGNYLYRLPPEVFAEDFFLGQLTGHFASIVNDVYGQYCDDVPSPEPADGEFLS